MNKLIPIPKDAISEIITSRGLNSKTFDLGDGRRRVIADMRIAHVPDKPDDWQKGKPVNWQDIDTDWELSDGKYRVKNAWYEVEVFPDEIAFHYTSKRKGDVSISLKAIDNISISSLSLQINPRLDGDKIWFDDVLPGLDIYIRAFPAKVEIFKVLKNDQAPTNFTWQNIVGNKTNIKIPNFTKGWDNFNKITRSTDDIYQQHLIRKIRLLHNVGSIDKQINPGKDTYDFSEEFTGETIIVDNITRQKSYIRQLVFPVLIDAQVTEDIENDADDGHQDTDDNYAVWLSSVIKMNNANPYYPGWRFRTVADVPQGATITNATLTVWVHQLTTTGAGDIYGYDIDTAPEWQGYPAALKLPGTMAKTGAGGKTAVSWSATGSKVETVTDIVQEIVNRGGWSPGNAMSFGIINITTAPYCYLNDMGAANPGQLMIDYETASSSSSSEPSSSSSSSESSSSSSSESSSSSSESSSSSSESSSSSSESSSSSSSESSSSSSSESSSSSSESSSSSSESSSSSSESSSSSSSESSSSSSESSSSSSSESSSSSSESSSSSSSESSSSSSESSSSSSESSSSSSSESSSSSSESSSSSSESSSSSSESSSSSSSESSSSSSESSSSSSESSSSSSSESSSSSSESSSSSSSESSSSSSESSSSSSESSSSSSSESSSSSSESSSSSSESSSSSSSESSSSSSSESSSSSSESSSSSSESSSSSSSESSSSSSESSSSSSESSSSSSSESSSSSSESSSSSSSESSSSSSESSSSSSSESSSLSSESSSSSSESSSSSSESSSSSSSESSSSSSSESSSSSSESSSSSSESSSSSSSESSSSSSESSSSSSSESSSSSSESSSSSSESSSSSSSESSSSSSSESSSSSSESSSSSSESSSSSSESSSSSSSESSSSSSSESSSSSSESSSSSSESSSSSSSTGPGEWCWGHDTAVQEEYIGDLGDGAGTGTVAGINDAEKLTLEGGEDWTLPAIQTGAVEIEIEYDKYQAGSGSGTIQWRTGANKGACEAAGWNNYVGHFTSTGWIQIKTNN